MLVHIIKTNKNTELFIDHYDSYIFESLSPDRLKTTKIFFFSDYKKLQYIIWILHFIKVGLENKV